ncbi:hemolysin activation/secretion protein [Pelomonas saccharophila]|uniref:Hemolysin activation/secretion protein n=1 Tax=Roseateles saccharophilus TaxID=304 RepID=A0ABU1YXQ8_ROSSA|nr:ShlB/FhaC/HecB family hemolysin secretion/activation protein [Roseateles saccharophilus]MDR7273035.1 hemolysin activation/secretion protein [Roseateles saccharophilus]
MLPDPRHCRRSPLRLSLLAVQLLAGASCWAAGTPPVVPTPAELARPPEAARNTELPPERPPVARELGKPDDELKIDVPAYSLAPDAPAALREALPRLTAAFVGKERGFEDLVNAANEVTRFLQRDLGYYLGYAYIPEQVFDGQTVRIAILEGRLDRVVLNWSDGLPVDREVVEAYLARLKPGDVLTVDAVERTVFLINDLRGIVTRAEVKAGSTPGTAILEFTPRAEARYSGSIDGDLNGSKVIGAQRLGVQVVMASPLGRGDGLSASALASTGGGLLFALLGYTSPIGADGFKAGASLSAVRYQLDKKEFPLGLDGTGTTLNLFALYPWVRSRNLNLFALGAVDAKFYVDNVAALSTKKRVDDASVGVSGDFRDSLLTGSVNTFELNLAQGRLSFADGPPPNSDDAASFRKLTFAASRLQNVLSNRLLAYFTMRGQWALSNLDSTEQFRAGGPNGVRAFAPGEGTGDSGLVASLELRWLPPASLFGRWANELVLAAFFDGAAIRYRHDPDLVLREPGYVNRAYLGGAGLSLVWARSNEYAFRMSLAKPTHGHAVGEADSRKLRFYAQGSWSF